jgi:two-component system chemotaxis sensor kinase CheA
MDDLLADFLTETNEALADLDLALVKLERAPDDAQTLSLIFRHVHTVKGTCGFLGLSRLERVAHSAENVLGKLRDRVLPVTPEVISAVLAGLDRIKEIVAGIAASGSEPTGKDGELILALDAIAEGKVAPVAAPPPPPSPRRPRHRLPPRRRHLRPRHPLPPCAKPRRRRRPRTASRSAPRRPSASPSTCWKT